MKKNYKYILGLTIAVMAALNACGDDSKSTSGKTDNDSACVENATKCEDLVFKICNHDGEFVVSQECGQDQTCDDALGCVKRTGGDDENKNCKENEKVCDGDVLKICTNDAYVLSDDCSSNGLTCDEKKLQCVPKGNGHTESKECEETERKCDGSVLKACDNGSYVTVKDCAESGLDCDKSQLECVSQACNQETGNCMPVPEKRQTGDDSDVLSGVTLPEKRPLPDNPCLKCDHTQVCVNNVCETGPRHVISIAKPFTSENGDKAILSIATNHRPTSDVTFECTVVTESPYDEAQADCAGKLTPADSDWIVTDYGAVTRSIPLTITGLPDNVDDGDQKYYVLVKTVSEDTYLNGVVHAPMRLTNQNIDRAGLSLISDKPLITHESGTSADFSLVLRSKPLAPVKLKLRSSDITEGTVQPKTLIFTPENWNVPQQVIATGVDDTIADNSVNYDVLIDAVSVDPKYNKEDILLVTLVNVNDDSPGLAITTSSFKLRPSDNRADITVSLAVAPESDVKVKLHVLPNFFTFEPEEIVFTPSDWETPQNITMVYHADSPNISNAITMVAIDAIPEAEGSYENAYSNFLYMYAYAYDTFEFSHTAPGKEEHISLVPGEYKLEVWGSQGNSTLNGMGGLGGYSYGTIEFKEKTDLYINVGGIPYNGGYSSGGGASHIATVSGQLPALSDQRDKVLLVAGGGGGSERTPGGYGGGIKGGDGSPYGTHTSISPTGGTQTEGGVHGTDSIFGTGTDGTFGQGGNGIGQPDPSDPRHSDGGPGGGGGWYGGGGVPYAGGAGGGSGYVSDKVKGETIAGSEDFPSPNGGIETGHAGYGNARISIVDRFGDN